ncbi:MAG: hypothetical protein ACM3UZ_09120 [Acidobacteriota bacterium]
MADTTILESIEWYELQMHEKEVGPEELLEEILEKRLWNNAEILWVTRRLIFHYALHDKVLKKAPMDKVFDNFVSFMKGIFMIIDQSNLELDDNLNSYIATKLRDATWGINSGTRYYLEKKKD